MSTNHQQTTSKWPQTTSKLSQTTNKRPQTTSKQPQTTSKWATTKYLQTTTNHQQTTTNHQQTITDHQQTTANHQQTTTNHQQTTTNYQIGLFWISIIYFFRKLETRRILTNINKHRHLTSLCNLIYTLHNSWNINLFSFYKRSASLELNPLSLETLFKYYFSDFLKFHPKQ